MEEKTNKESKKIELNDLVNEYINELIDYDEFEKGIIEWSVKYSNLENIGKNLKPFDLNSAKAGKPVCTRDGRQVRIICFDKKNDYYPIVALVEIDGKECIFQYTKDGEYLDGNENCSHYNLMMLPEKKEGWVNVYHGLNEISERVCGDIVSNTKEEAIQHAQNEASYITTVKIEWEEQQIVRCR